MNKKLGIVLGILLILGVVMVSGCTSDDTSSDTYTPNSGSSNSNYQVTAGTTSDGMGYAYDNQGNVAVSDGENTYGMDAEGNVYEYK